MALYSIIIPSFNPGPQLLKCIESLNGMSYDKSKFEVIIVDDGSTDGSIQRLEKTEAFELKIFIFKCSNQGAATARNLGIKKTRKEIIIFLDQDVVVDNNLLWNYDNAFRFVKADAVQGNIWEQIVDNKLTRRHAKWRRVVFINKTKDHNGFIKTMVTRNVAIRRSVLNKMEEKYGYIFNESFGGTGGEDRELGYRMHDSGFKIFLEPKAIVKHNDPDTLMGILVQKFKHAQGDVKHGIGEKFLDFNNFQRAVIIPIKNGIPVYFALLLWLSHIAGAESQKMKYHINSFNEGTYHFLKRSIDVFGSTVGLIVGLPGLLFISVFIKIDSSGPVIFKQKRVGVGGKEFGMFKFRTMVVDAETILQKNPQLMAIYKNSSYKIKDDPRVTRVGKVLRKLSLDELPQLVNILKGEMSIVGPRAYKKDEIENQLKIHPELKKYSEMVISVKPGLTGVWQTSGRSDVGFEKRIVLDYEYAKKKSLLFDLSVMFRTIPVVLKSRGAW